MTHDIDSQALFVYVAPINKELHCAWCNDGYVWAPDDTEYPACIDCVMKASAL
jgi:hypothetical protein